MEPRRSATFRCLSFNIRLSLTRLAPPGNQDVVVYPTKELRKIQVYNPVVSRLDLALFARHGLVRERLDGRQNRIRERRVPLFLHRLQYRPWPSQSSAEGMPSMRTPLPAWLSRPVSQVWLVGLCRA